MFVYLIDQGKRKVNLDHLETQFTSPNIPIIMKRDHMIGLLASGRNNSSRERLEKELNSTYTTKLILTLNSVNMKIRS